MLFLLSCEKDQRGAQHVTHVLWRDVEVFAEAHRARRLDLIFARLWDAMAGERGAASACHEGGAGRRVAQVLTRHT